MKNLIDVMIDFETLGIGPDAMVLQIAAVYFDRVNGAHSEKRLKINIDPNSYKDHDVKHTIDVGTVMFWLNQTKEAQERLLSGNIDNTSQKWTESVTDAFSELNEFLRDAKYIWCHKDFDFVILQNTLKNLDIVPSFKFYTGRDLRTLLDLANYDHRKHKFNGVKHDALDDCLFQIDYAVKCFERIGNK